MEAKIYLLIQGKEPKYGLDKESRREPGTIRVEKTRPNTRSDEIALQLNLTIPDAIFFKPQLVANVNVPESADFGPQISCEVQDNIAQAIRAATGMEVRISVDGSDLELENQPHG